jgi:hypothetical protein
MKGNFSEYFKKWLIFHFLELISKLNMDNIFFEKYDLEN